MKRIHTLLLFLLAVATTYATPKIEQQGETLVITVNAHGDLAAGNFTPEQLNATHVKIVTANGVKLSQADWQEFFGVDYTTKPLPFPAITDLDLALAELENDNVIHSLGYNSPMLNGGKQLGELVLPESIVSTTFSFNDNKSKWTSVVFPNATKKANESTTVIGGSVFSSNTWIQKLIVGTSVKSIGAQAFNGCVNLTEVEYLYGLTHVSQQAFWGCTGLTTVILPESIIEIGHGAFEACTELTTLRLPNSLKTIKQEAFSKTGITSVVISASVETVETSAFGEIKSLTDVYVLGTNTKAANDAFQPSSHLYGYSYDGAGQGEEVKLTDFTTSTGYYTLLHYPDLAYDRYVNRFIRVIGTEQYASSGYSPYYNHWVVDANKNKYPAHDYGVFTNPGSDYAGWNQFMLTGKLKDTYRDERLVEGKWYSVCFPFDISEKEIQNAFGSGTEVCEFSGVDITNDPNVPNTKYITLNFKTEVKDMKAHHPYMIHPSLHGASYNVIVDVQVDTDTDHDNFAKKLKDEKVSYTVDGVEYTFIGNHTEGAKVPRYSYYYYSGNNTKWENAFYKAMRDDVVFTPHTAVVQLSKDNGVSSSAAKQNYVIREFKMLDDNETTGINELPARESSAVATLNNNVYSITGQMVRQGTTDLGGLPAGIYIVKGKKYIVK